jgi:sec-independent protein translocase protein TatA
MDAIQPWHVAVLAVAALMLLYVPHKLPEMSRSVGRSLRIFKAEMKDVKDEVGQVAGTKEKTDA